MLLQMQINRLLTIMFCVLGPRLPRNFSPLLSRRYRSNQFKLHFLEACRTQQNLVCRENYFLAMVFPGVWFQVCSLAAKVGLDFLTCWIGTYTLTFNDRITDFWILFTYELKVFWQTEVAQKVLARKMTLPAAVFIRNNCSPEGVTLCRRTCLTFKSLGLNL